MPPLHRGLVKRSRLRHRQPSLPFLSGGADSACPCHGHFQRTAMAEYSETTRQRAAAFSDATLSPNVPSSRRFLVTKAEIIFVKDATLLQGFLNTGRRQSIYGASKWINTALRASDESPFSAPTRQHTSNSSRRNVRCGMQDFLDAGPATIAGMGIRSCHAH